MHGLWQLFSNAVGSTFSDGYLRRIRGPVGKRQGCPSTGTCHALACPKQGPCNGTAQGGAETNQWLCLLRGPRWHGISCSMATWLHAGHERRCSHRGAGRTIWRNNGIRARCTIRRGAWQRTAPFESRCEHPGRLHGPTHDDSLDASGKGAAMIHLRTKSIRALALSALGAFAFSLHGQPITGNPTAHTYSRTFNVSEAEAKYRSMKSISAAALEARIQTSEPDTFGGLYVEHKPEFKIVVLFTKKPRETLAKYTQDPVFTGRTSSQSFEMLLATQAEAEAQLLAKKVGFESGVDIKRSIVTFYVKDEAAARRALRPLLGAVDFISIKQVKGFTITTAISGGHKLTGTAFNCTTGFNVFDADRELGVLTAGHCDNTLTYQGITAPLVFQSEQNVGDYDVQWHKEPPRGPRHAQKNEITLINGPSQTLEITSTLPSSSMHVGDVICKSGIHGHYACGTIEDMNSRSNHNGAIGRYIRARNLSPGPLSVEGDSGGPVFSNNAAVGVIHGRGGEDTGFENDLFYMPIERVSVLGVSVLTEAFKITGIADRTENYFRPFSVPVAYKGVPKFPIELTLERPVCPSGPCEPATETLPDKMPSPLSYTWTCFYPIVLYPPPVIPPPPLTWRERVTLKDASGITADPVEYNLHCSGCPDCP
ncbi:Trypsin-like serine protease [Stenotrophomonas maltophilia]